MRCYIALTEERVGLAARLHLKGEGVAARSRAIVVAAAGAGGEQGREAHEYVKSAIPNELLHVCLHVRLLWNFGDAD